MADSSRRKNDQAIHPPYALLLPALTEDEYRALKADIAEHGILYPVIVDDENKVLDGVHRLRIASELDIELPVSRHEGLSDERKMHLAVGLNMRRRHLDADRRRALVRKLNKEEGLSLREIASITGWSKSTIDRDLKASPFEDAIATLGRQKSKLANISNETVRESYQGINDGFDSLFRWADGRWKQGNWPPANDEELLGWRMNLWCVASIAQWTTEVLKAKANDEELPPSPISCSDGWTSGAWTPAIPRAP